ncbi:MAG: hypothetical protein KAV87_27370, partial [Desulfobacteraceae bacterium]|nr:hypothetical protein [Desulfobacteraceae bacterium]
MLEVIIMGTGRDIEPTRKSDYKVLSKKQVYDEGLLCVKGFLHDNGLTLPIFSLELPIQFCTNKHQMTGLYLPTKRTVYVNLKKTASIGYGGPAWSFPSYKIDKTPFGVVCHEVGHHVDLLLNCPSRSKKWLELHELEKVSGYELIPSESFAESMRLFITNPDLLRAGCPGRYKHITDGLGLRPIAMGNWIDVLEAKRCPSRQIEQAKKWVKEQPND